MKKTIITRTILALTLIGGCAGCTRTQGFQVDATRSGARAEVSSWQNDVAAFDKKLSAISADARVPTKEELVGDGRSGFGDDWTVITDGAGGVVDLKPEPGTVQHAANEALKAQAVRWAFVLAQDEVNLGGTTALMPDLGFDASKSLAELSPDKIPHLGMILVRASSSRSATMGALKAGDRVVVEGKIGDASKNRGFIVTSFEGPVVLYHLSNAGHPAFWVGLTEANIKRDKARAAE